MPKYFDKQEQTITAGEIITTGICPLNCTYCYIPKNPSMKNVHSKIIENIKSGKIFDQLETMYGKDLHYFSFWGTEPLLTLDLITERIPEIWDRFPKIFEWSFSTSLMIDTDPILRFITALDNYATLEDKERKLREERILKEDKNILFKIQISLDGPAFITDKNRMKGAAKKIPENFEKLLQEIKCLDLDTLHIEFSWKSTLGMDNIKLLNRNMTRIDQWFEYFNDLYRLFYRYFPKDNKQITIIEGSHIPTLVVPGKYTVADGKLWATYLRNVRRLGHEITYDNRLDRMFYHEDEIQKKRMFTCSGGDSNFGIGNNIHICHRSFYYDHPEYIDSVLNENDIENWDVSHFRKGSLDNMRKYFIIDPEDHGAMVRLLYTMRGYHDFWRLQLDYIHVMLIEMADAGQADIEYKHNEELRLLFGMFFGTCMSCPMENLLNTGTLHFQTISLIRLWANGAFQELLEYKNRRHGFYDTLKRRYGDIPDEQSYSQLIIEGILHRE